MQTVQNLDAAARYWEGYEETWGDQSDCNWWEGGVEEGGDGGAC